MNLSDALEKTTALQTSLYQAAKENPVRRFHALYDKLSREDVLLTAWEQVRQNRGAPGIDGMSIKAFEAQGAAQLLAELAQELKEKRYRPQPVRRVEIPKGPGKTRPLGVPTVRDRVVQAAAKIVMEPIFEADFCDSSTGFRPGIGQRTALAAVRDHAVKGFRYVVDADIEGFFDNLDHEELMAAVRRRISDAPLLRLIWCCLKAGVMVAGVREDTARGTPQGGVLSPLLANIYLHGFDKAHEGQRSFIGRLTRYADDFVIQCGSRLHAERALAWAAQMLTKLGLRLHPGKTRIVEDTEGFDFLGFHHRRCGVPGQPGYPTSRRWPSSRSVQKFRDQFRDRLRTYGPLRVGTDWPYLRERVNAYLRGYSHYFRNGNSARVLYSLDRFVVHRLARYLARCQPRGVKRRKRPWADFAIWVRQRGGLYRMSAPGPRDSSYKGLANVRWKAV
jgi:RNA-directed DNA polymerase